MAAFNSPFPLLFLLLATTTLFLHTTTAAHTPAPASPPLLGGYTPIPIDQSVEDLARFAINEHNRQKYDHLVYSKTLKAERQLVNGYNYRLIISAYRPHGVTNNFEAIVYVPFGPGPKPKLTRFKGLRGTAPAPAPGLPWPGGYPRIPVNDKVKGLARFAVEEYNNKFNIDGKLSFSEVMEAKRQIVAGTNYYLYLSAVENGKTSLFDAFVFESLKGSRELTSFKRHLLKAR